MSRVLGFNGDYEGLSENEAWTRVYDVGKNLMPIRNSKIQKKYNNMFKKKTKVIRSGKVQTIKTDVIVPDDIILIEKGNFIPVDGIILEEKGLDLENDIMLDTKLKEVDGKNYVADKPVYQGMKVRAGRALIEAKRTGATTFLGETIKEIDVPDSKKGDIVRGYSLFNSILSIVFFVLLTVISLFKFGRVDIAIKTGIVGIIAIIPIAFVGVVLYRVINRNEGLKKSRLVIKNILTLFKIKKIDVICIDSKFLKKDYTSCIRNIYNIGTSIIVISENDLEEVELIANEAGISTKDTKSFSGNQIDNMSEEELISAVCEGVIFYNISHSQKKKIIKAFKTGNISVLSVGDGIEDLFAIAMSIIGISSNNVKGSIDNELADAYIYGNDFLSIYQLIKNKLALKREFINCFYFNTVFQIPLIVLTLFFSLWNVIFTSYLVQLIILALVVLPLMLFLSIRKYNDEELFSAEVFKFSFGKFLRSLLIGLGLGLIFIIEYLGLGVLINSEVINITILMFSIGLVDLLVVKLLKK